jgi:GTPase SAR1 family protein
MDGIKTKIRIDKEVLNGKRGIYFDEILSHHVGEKELQEILKRARISAWKSDKKEGQELGTHLFDLFNGSGGKLRETIKKSYDRGEPLHLYFAIPFELDALPIELLFDKHFLPLDSNIHIIRQVTDRNRLRNIVREKRRLKILFMACSPMDLGDSVLQFEKEEENIQKSIEKFQIEMTVEDSGSLDGLKNALMEANGYDIVHITGHAGIDPKLGPVFYMENEIGELAKVTPEMLGEILKDFLPRVLFLSGCSTGKGDKVNEVESFAYRMVEHNIPVVLGWGLPVSDTGATIMTTKLYEYLAMGKDIDFAVQRARQEVEKEYHPWPLLRLFTDSSPLIAIIDPKRPLMPRPHRRTRYKHLADSEVKVLEYGFIGRRREIQHGTKVLRGEKDKYGLLIRGTAGVGKSCLAGKLIERFHEKSLVVFHGEVRAADIVSKLKRLFEEKNTKSGTDILGSAREYEEKIKALFHTTFKELPTVLYFDDFEQNLTRHGDIHQIKPEALEVLKPLFYAFNLYKSSALEINESDQFKGLTNLVITSRYPFVMEVDGRDLAAESLEDIPLMSFKGADLIKKEKELPNIKKSEHRGLYLEYGKGNPRLLEWLEKLAGEEEKYDLEELRRTLQGKTEEFISKYLADVIAKTTGEDFHQFLHQAAVFRQPVESSAYELFGTREYLDKGVGLTLFERENVPGHEPLFWVTPVIRDSQWDMLSQEEKKDMHRIAFQWYDATIGKSQTPDYRYREEAVYHALESSNIRGACKHAIVLGKYLSDLLLYKDTRDLLQNIYERITDEIIREAVKEKDGTIATLINNLGYVMSDLGDAKKAIEYITKALEIFKAIYGVDHPSTKTVQINLDSLQSN